MEVVGAISGVDVLLLKDSDGPVARLGTVRRRSVRRRGVGRGSVGRGRRRVGRCSVGRGRSGVGRGDICRAGPVGTLGMVGDSHQGNSSDDELKRQEFRVQLLAHYINAPIFCSKMQIWY